MRSQNHSIKARKLTKQYLMSRRAGSYLVGNICDHHCSPEFAELVTPKSERREQWERIKAARANGRLCGLFRDQRTFERQAKRKQASALRHGYKH